MKTNNIFTAILTTLVMLSMMPAGFAQTKSDDDAVGFSVKNMDVKADPRKDFGRYATGGWMDRTVIGDAQVQVLAASGLLNMIDARVFEIAQNAAAATGSAKTGDVQRVGDFYTAAMNTKLINELGIKPVQGLLDEVARARTPRQFAEINAIMGLRFGKSPFLNADVDVDEKDVSKYSLSVQSAVDSIGLGLNRDQYVNEKNQAVRESYRDMIAGLLEAAGDTPDSARRSAEKALALEIELAQSTLTPTQTADPNATYNLMTPAQLKSLVPAIDLDTYFERLGIRVPETVVVNEPEALKSLQKSLASRSVEDLRDYYRTFVLRRTVGTLGGPILQIKEKYDLAKAGVSSGPPREKVVVSALGVLMAHPVSKLYVAKYFRPEQKKAVDEMMDLIKAEFKKRIEANDWLAESTRKTALAKLERISVMIGYPAKDSDWIDYGSVKITPDDYFGNIARAREFLARRKLGDLGKPVELDKFTVPGKVTPISVNAAIHQGFLAVYVPAAFINPPYYVASNDAAANFGSLGAFVGHELTHAFDSKGRAYDASGNLRDWWTPEDTAKFKARSQKLVDQYNAYEVAPGVKVNGQLTLSENIADLGGMTLAYSALQTYMKKNGRLQVVDGLTPEQRFFVAWAQTWMAKTRVQGLKMLVATDPHPPSEVRSFGPAVNMNEFFTAFNIKEGDPMWRDPKDRVTIW